MKLTLQTKVTVFIAATIILISLVSTLLFTNAYRRSIEREVVARGYALSDALARSVDESLAGENLNLIKHVEDIVHPRDVVLTQVFSSLWLGVASVPHDQHNTLPSAEAIEYFKKRRNEQDHFYQNQGPWIDVYTPIFLDPHDSRVPKVFIGYVRMRISTQEAHLAIRRAVTASILAAIMMSVIAVLALNAIIRRYVLSPILGLHRSVSLHRKGELPEAIPVTTSDEIGDLSREFNEMSLALREREERLAEEKERLTVTLRSIGDGVIVTDIRGMVTMINKVAEHFTGWTAAEAVGRPLGDVFCIISERTRERSENPVARVIGSGIIVGLANHTVLIRKDKTEIQIEDSAAPIRDRKSAIVGVVLVFRDVTEKKRIEEELVKAEKLQSVGLLAGGIAHDFNNLLTSIVGNISLAKMFIDPRSKAFGRLADAESASRRATDLTYQLLTFSKGGAPVRQSSSIGDILRESAGFALSGTNVSAVFKIGADVRNAEVDAGQMSQVFNNLIINAVQAMPNGGSIEFSVSDVVLSDTEIATLASGPYIKIAVRDTGPGIPPEHLPRIFDPYFTTKQKGSGLGLASVYSIVKKHDGHITVDSKVSQGTTFTIYLPASRTAQAAGEEPTGAAAPGRGRVLLMDDEAIVREVSGEMLRALGYEVEFACSGAEAVEQYQKALQEKRPFDCVVMDLTIPGGMGGRDTVRKLHDLDANVNAIVSSGYSNDPIMSQYEQFGFRGVITKPYTIESFSTALRRVLDR